MSRPKMTITKIWSLIEKDQNSGCWLWRGYVNPNDGYGRVWWNNSFKLVHRVVFEFVKGRIQKGFELHHNETCPKICVNPNHLTQVTHDTHPDSPTVMNKNKTHCVNGHELTKENTYIYLDKNLNEFRECKTCARNRSRYGNPHGLAEAIS